MKARVAEWLSRLEVSLARAHERLAGHDSTEHRLMSDVSDLRGQVRMLRSDVDQLCRNVSDIQHAREFKSGK